MKTNNKKPILVILAIVIALCLISAGTFVVIKSAGDKTSKTDTSKPTKAKADDLKAQALKAQKENNNTKAKELLLQSQKQYEELGDTNNVVDTKALISIIESMESKK